VLFYAQKRQISWLWNGYGVAPTWLRQVSHQSTTPASHDHFNHCVGL